jgi:hypothetical protein
LALSVIRIGIANGTKGLGFWVTSLAAAASAS